MYDHSQVNKWITVNFNYGYHNAKCIYKWNARSSITRRPHLKTGKNTRASLIKCGNDFAVEWQIHTRLRQHQEGIKERLGCTPKKNFNKIFLYISKRYSLVKPEKGHWRNCVTRLVAWRSWPGKKETHHLEKDADKKGTLTHTTSDARNDKTWQSDTDGHWHAHKTCHHMTLAYDSPWRNFGHHPKLNSPRTQCITLRWKGKRNQRMTPTKKGRIIIQRKAGLSVSNFCCRVRPA